jgi:peptide/nickel transport system substrate-binding protein
MIAPELFPLSKDFVRPKADPEAAKKLLAEAGYHAPYSAGATCSTRN